MFRNAITAYIKLDLPAPFAPVRTVIGLMSRSPCATERKFLITKRIVSLPAMSTTLRYSNPRGFANPLRTFPSSQISPNILCSLLLAHCFQHGLIDSLRFFAESQMLQHHRGRRDRPNRIGYVLPGKRWG